MVLRGKAEGWLNRVMSHWNRDEEILRSGKDLFAVQCQCESCSCFTMFVKEMDAASEAGGTV